MNRRVAFTRLAPIVLAALLCVSAQSQSLRATPQLGLSRSAQAVEAAARPADYIVAVVNSEPVTNNEVRTRLLRVEQQLAQQGQVLPPREELTRQVLDRLIDEKAQLQLARENGLKIDDAAVDRTEQNVAQQNQVDVAELRRRLTGEGLSAALFREDLRNQLLLARVREREVELRVRVSDAEADQFLREQQVASEAAASEINLAQILIAVPENANEQQLGALRARAQRVHERASAGEDFAKLAREYSDAPNVASNGGALGLRPADRYPPLFVEATAGLRDGGISAVVRSGAGFHVLTVLERRQGGMPGINVIQSHARHILLQPDSRAGETAARQRLADIKRRIESGNADFAEMARQFSQDGSARNGGDLGWTKPGLFVPEFEEHLNTLSPGQIGEPFVSRFGVHLVQLLERRQITLDRREQREIARNLVREKKLDQAYTEWAREVRGRAYVEYRDPPQ